MTDKVTCKYCNGKGEIRTQIETDGESRTHVQECPICGGDGELDQQETMRIEHEEE